MSLVLTDKAKYRLTGGVVFITSVLVILPSLMKKSNQRFEENLSLSLKAPPKPNAPQMHIPSAKQVFSKVKTIQTQTPKITERPVKVELAKAEMLALPSKLPTIPMHLAESNIDVKSADRYAIQLAVFTHQENADFLMKRLKKMGYAADLNLIKSKNGSIYKVVVGPLNNKDNAIQLQKQLAQNTQLEGLIIRQG